MADRMPYMQNVTGYFDMSTLDVANNRWVNGMTGGNNMTLSGGTIEDEALKLSEGDWGELVIDDPDVIYIVCKKPTSDELSCIIGRGKTGGTRTDLSLFNYVTPSCRLSLGGTPYIDANVDISNYCVIAIVRIADVDTNGKDSAMLFVNGSFYGCMTDAKKANYAGFVTINRHLIENGAYNTPGINPLYIKAIVTSGSHTVEQIISNSKFFMGEFITEDDKSEIAGADAAAVAWCMAVTLQQAASLKNQILSYKKGIIDGDDGGTTDIVVDDDGSTPIEIPVDPDETDPTAIEKTAERGAEMWYTAGDDETGDIYYIRIYTLDTEGVGSSEMGNYRYRYADQLVYDLYNENGTAITEEVPIRTYFNYAVPLNSWFITPEYVAPGGYTNYDVTVYVKSVRIERKTIIVDYRSINNTTGEIYENSNGTNITGIPENVTIQRTTSEKPF